MAIEPSPPALDTAAASAGVETAEHGCLDDRLLDTEQAREAVSHGDSLSRSDDTASADA